MADEKVHDIIVKSVWLPKFDWSYLLFIDKSMLLKAFISYKKILARKKSFSLFDINSQPKNQQIIAHNW